MFVGVSAKPAPTLLASVIETVHVPVPVQAPVQPVKVEPVSGVAVSVTDVPCAYVPEQVVPHEIPDGEDDTTPVPVPDFAIVSGYVLIAKVAFSVWFAVTAGSSYGASIATPSSKTVAI